MQQLLQCFEYYPSAIFWEMFYINPGFVRNSIGVCNVLKPTSFDSRIAKWFRPHSPTLAAFVSTLRDGEHVHHLYRSGFSRKTAPTGCIHREILLKGLAYMIVGLASPKSSGQASILATPLRADGAVLSPKAVQRHNSLFLRNLSLCLYGLQLMR